jgi:S-adenosyl-L-methionine hydrolase (adenosine-forming)
MPGGEQRWPASDLDASVGSQRMPRAPVITFLSDYGHADHFVGVCHGVIATICPQARVIDISHGVPRHDVRAGSLMLRAALPFMPLGVHLAVVDPDVGAERRAVALRLGDDRILVGPDNGLLSSALDAGVAEAVDIGGSPLRLEPVSATFHGRDLFAPVAAHLARGASLAEAGEPCDPDQLVRLEVAGPRIENGVLVAHAQYVDRFGNVQLDAGQELARQLGLKLGDPLLVGGEHAAHYVRTFADARPGELLVYEDSDGRFAVAVSHGSAAQLLALTADDELSIRPGA